MAANTTPIFTGVPKIQWEQITALADTTDGTHADVELIFTADATDGSFLQKIVAQPRSTSGSTTTTATALRIYVNNGSTNGTAANNVLVKEVTLPATAVNVTQSTASLSVEIPMNIMLAPGYRIYVSVAHLAANTQWAMSAFGGDY